MCDRCGKSRENVATYDVECGPSPDAPEGYASQMDLCAECAAAIYDHADETYKM